MPTDLLPPAVLGDALIQLTEAIDGNQLAPPFLPYELFGKLYSAQPVMRSLQVAVEEGPAGAAAAAEAAAHAAAAAQDVWTVRIGGTGDGPAAAEEASAAGGASGSSSALAREAAESEGAAAVAGSTLMLLPLQASSEPLATLLQRLVGAVLSCLLRRAGAALDAASLRCVLLAGLTPPVQRPVCPKLPAMAHEPVRQAITSFPVYLPSLQPVLPFPCAVMSCCNCWACSCRQLRKAAGCCSGCGTGCTR